MRKGEVYQARVENYDFPNKGSFMMEDRKVTVKGALKGQQIEFMVTKRKSGMAEGRLLQVLEKSPIEDATPDCPYFGVCGGCAYQTLSYENQLKLKEEMVKKLLDKAIPDDYEWEGILGSPDHECYRNKMEFTFGDEYKDGPLALGLHKKGSFHDILNVSGCKIIGEDWSKILDYTLEFFRERKVPFYHRMRHTGILRNLVIRQSKANGEFLINLVTTTQWGMYGSDEWDGTSDAIGADRDLADIKVLKEYVVGLLELARDEDFTGTIAGVLYTENDTLGDVVKSDRTVCLYGKDYITEEIMGLKFKISPFSFFQTNTKGCEVLYTKAREYIMSMKSMSGESYKVVGSNDGDVGADAKDEGAGVAGSGKVVFDLYSGTGTIAQMMSEASGKVIGIEIVEEAVEAAKENAKLNGLTNCQFIAGDVLKAIDLVEDKPDVIILDPPRDGINPKALDKILAFGVREMVYISCKPTSLARDLEIITNRGYKVVKACAVDQFPRTSHVECVTLLQRKNT